jgi:hypothetical protein
MRVMEIINLLAYGTLVEIRFAIVLIFAINIKGEDNGFI